MRSCIDIDEQLLAKAMRLTGAKTAQEVVELGLAALLQLRCQESLHEWRGKLLWEGDLKAMRNDG